MWKDIKLKKMGLEEKVEGKVIVFCDRGFAIENHYQEADGSYIKKVIDRFEINFYNSKNHEKTLKKELAKHLNAHTKVVYINEKVAEYLEKNSPGKSTF